MGQHFVINKSFSVTCNMFKIGTYHYITLFGTKTDNCVFGATITYFAPFFWSTQGTRIVRRNMMYSLHVFGFVRGYFYVVLFCLVFFRNSFCRKTQTDNLKRTRRNLRRNKVMLASAGRYKGAKDELRSLQTPSKAKIGGFRNLAAAAGACASRGIGGKPTTTAKNTSFISCL